MLYNFYYELKNDILNWVAIWCMKHCCCYATILYTAFTRYYPNEVKAMYKSWAEYNGLE